MNESSKVDIDEMFRLGTPIDEAIEQAGQDAIREHRQTGLPLVCCKDGKTVFIDPYTLNEVNGCEPIPRPAGY